MKTFFEFYQQMSKGRLKREDTLGQKDPIRLSQINQNVAIAAIDSGLKDNNPTDDVLQPNSSFSAPAQSLNPSQTEIILIKAFNMAMNTTPVGGKFEPGGDLGAIVSEDNYIMDGHHRWASTLLVKPDASITATLIPLPGQKLVSLLNIYTASKGIKGNPAVGNLKEFTGDNIQKNIIDVAKQSGQSPDHPDVKGYSWNDLQQKISMLGKGNFENGLQLIKRNADQIGKRVLPEWAPPRVEMPVIQKTEIPDLVAKLTKGEIDFNAPNSQQTLNAMKGMGTTPTNNAPAQPAAPVANPAPTNAGAPAGTPPAQNASTFHPGLNMSEQLLVLSGVLTIEQAEDNLKRRRRR
jgi:hypothetical protein